MADNPEHYPGVERAYDFVLPSYGWTLTRLEAADSRIQALQVFAVTFTFAIPAAAKALYPDIHYSSWRFVAAMLAFVALIVLGVLARIRGGWLVLDPQKLWEKWLQFPEWEFKKNAVYWAGEHFKINVGIVHRKSNTAIQMTVLFLVELLLLLAWAATATVFQS